MEGGGKRMAWITLTYNEQLQTPEWFARRDEIKERDNNQCVVCGRQNELQVHHKYYIEGLMAWEHPNEIMVTVCDLHHLFIHFPQIYNKYEKEIPRPVIPEDVTRLKRLREPLSQSLINFIDEETEVETIRQIMEVDKILNNYKLI